MKKFHPLFRNSIACVAVLLFSSLFWTETASAQISSTNPQDQNWMIVDEAISTIQQEIAVIENQLQFSYNESLDYKRKYYSVVQFLLQEGDMVPVAVNRGYCKFVAGGTCDAPVESPNNIPVPVWQGYRNELTQLLQQ